MKYKWNVLVGLMVFVMLIGGLPSLSAQAAPFYQDDAVLDQIGGILATPATIFENFRVPDDQWEVIDDEDDFETYYYTGGYYVYVYAEELVAWGESTIELSDFYLEVDAFHAFGPLDNQFGVIFREVDVDNFYYFTVSSDGYYRLIKMLDGEWVNLVEWTASDLIATGEDSVNRLGVLAVGEQISILVNDELLATVEDDSFAAGIIGLAAGTYSEPEVEIAYDDMLIWDLTAAPIVDSEDRSEGEEETMPPLDALLDETRATEPLFADEFDAETDAWDMSPVDTGEILYADESLHIDVTTPNTMNWTVNQQLAAVGGGFLAEVDVMLAEGPDNTDMGLIFNLSDSANFNYFAIRADGTYSLWLKEEDGWTSLVDWTESPAIDTGATVSNRMGIYKAGSLVTLFANDEVLTQAPVDPFASGEIALAAAANGDEDIAVVFDNFVLWADDAVLAEEGEPEVEPTPAPTAELPDLSGRLADMRALAPDFSDDFRRAGDAWGLSEDENATIALVDRALEIRVDAQNWLSWSMAQAIEAPLPQRYFFEFDSELLEGSDDAIYGVIFNYADGDNFYRYTVSAQGTFSLLRKLEGEWETLVDWTAADTLETGAGAHNHLGLLVEDGQITLLANDLVLAQVEDDALQGGQIALTAGTYAEGGTVATFDNVDYWVLE
jgi:hypothetical protein